MADATHIEWTDATWNIVTGCSVVSPGCTNCYAMRLAGTRLQHHPSRAGLTTASKAGMASSSPKGDRPTKHVWNGQVRFNAEWLTQPLRWTRPRMIFVAAHGDLFHDGVTDDQLDQIFAVMALCPQHTFQILTKRPERMRAYLTSLSDCWRARLAVANDPGALPISMADVGRALGIGAKFSYDPPTPAWPLPNVWLGVSVEDQTRTDERIPVLLDTPAAVRWISAEPLLGPVDIGPWISTCYECGSSCGYRAAVRPPIERCEECGEECGPETEPTISEGCPKCSGPLEAVCPRCGHAMVYQHPDTACLDWVIVGGESGPGARPMHPDWARQLRDQCAAAGVPFLFKQWGNWAPSAITTDWAEGSGQAFIAWPDGQIAHGRAAEHGGRGVMLRDLGKKAAGRHLDGVLHDGFPGARA